MNKRLLKNQGGEMKNYAEFGNDLYVDYDNARPYGVPDMTMAHMHPGYELLLVLDPLPYSTVIDGKIFRGKGPMAMFIAPYCMHFTYYTDYQIKNKKFIAFYIGEDYMKMFDDDIVPVKTILGNTKARIFNISGHEEQLRRITEPIITEHMGRVKVAGKRYKDTSVKQKLLFGVVVNMIKELREDELTQNIADGKTYVADVIMYIVHNLDKKLNISDLAEQFFVSKDKLNRDFKRYAQMSIKDFITESRMNLAKSKLQEGKYSIREIAYMCGFDNDIYFYSFFKQHAGITPRDFAKSTHQ